MKKNLIRILILFCFAFTMSFYNVSFGVSQDKFNAACNRLQYWIIQNKNASFDINRYKYSDDKGRKVRAYSLTLPFGDSSTYKYEDSFFVVDADGQYWYQEVDNGIITESVPVTFKFEIKYFTNPKNSTFETWKWFHYYAHPDSGGNYYLLYTNASDLWSTDEKDSYVYTKDGTWRKKYVLPFFKPAKGYSDYILIESKNSESPPADGKNFETITYEGRTVFKIKENEKYLRKHLRFNVWVVPESGHGITEKKIWKQTYNPYYDVDKEFVIKGESIWDLIVGVVKAILKWLGELAIRVVDWIVSKLVFLICAGVKALIEAATADGITIRYVLFGNYKKVSIDYWDPNPPSNSIVSSLRPVVSFWYVKFRQIAITWYLVLLLYLGMKIMLSKNATTTEALKERLNVWLVGVIALFFFPFVMKAIYTINDTTVKLIDQETKKELNEAGIALSNTDMMNDIYDMAVNSTVLGITYLIMAGELVVILFAYYKRAFTVGFLITFFPIVCIKHTFDGITSGGKGRALGAWLREYCVQVFVNLIHVVTYTVIIDGAGESFVKGENGGKNFFLYILCVTFLFKAETICKDIFQIKSSTGLSGDFSKSGAAGLAFVRQAAPATAGLFKRNKTDTDKADAKEGSKMEQQRRNLEQTNASRNANGTSSSSTASGGTSTGGGGGATPALTPSTVGAPPPQPTLQEEFENAKTVLGARGMATRQNSFRFTYKSGLGKNGFTNLMKNVGENFKRNGRKAVIRGFGGLLNATYNVATFGIGAMARFSYW